MRSCIVATLVTVAVLLHQPAAGAAEDVIFPIATTAAPPAPPPALWHDALMHVRKLQQMQRQAIMQKPVNQFLEICDFYKRNKDEFTCGCDESTLTIGCETDVVCNNDDSKTCGFFYLYTKYKTTTWFKDTEICIHYAPTSDPNEYEDGCLTLSASDGDHIDQCQLTFEAGGDQQVGCRSCEICHVHDQQQIAFDIDCDNLMESASTRGCQVLEGDFAFFPGFRKSVNLQVASGGNLWHSSRNGLAVVAAPLGLLAMFY